MSPKIRITGTGCALADFVYQGVDFSGKDFKKFMSRKDGDGGLSVGKLVFTEELEKFAGLPYSDIISEITDQKEAETFNIGGPSIVSLLHASQILDENEYQVEFYGISGKDEISRSIREMMQNTPLDIDAYHEKSQKPTPFTHVLSDPKFDNGHGERTFINNIGAAWDLHHETLQKEFFTADIVCFGGTALTPNLHDHLHLLLEKVKSFGGLTIVNTVFDFRNEKQNTDKPWPLGNTSRSLLCSDLLIMDNVEALRISGFELIDDAINYFKQHTSAFIITRGPDTTIYYSDGTKFDKTVGELPISAMVSNKIKDGTYHGDTTGCGDNFTGGVIANIATQIKKKSAPYDLQDAVISGICAGGFACSYIGGTYLEKKSGEKRQQVEMILKSYLQKLELKDRQKDNIEKSNI